MKENRFSKEKLIENFIKLKSNGGIKPQNVGLATSHKDISQRTSEKVREILYFSRK